MEVLEGLRLGRYEVFEPLGSGGMGEVYRARDTVLGRDVALKLLPEDIALDPRRRARFEREARILARVSHPNIVAIHDFGTDGDQAYAVTELLHGETLRERIRTGLLRWPEAAAISAAVADGLAAAHERGVAHRDLKPENVFLTTDRRVKILDFGVARVAGSDPALADGSRPRTATLTRPGTTVGTVGYMSPEQVVGKPVDGRGDLFSLGCVLYEMLTGEHPFARDNDPETMLAILRAEPADLELTGADAPPQIERILERCLEKTPERRYQTAAELATDLRSVPSAAQAARPGLLRRWRRPSRRTRRLAAMTIVVLAILIVATTAVRQVARWTDASSTATLDPRTVMVSGFDNRTGDASLDPLGPMVAERISERLIESGMLQVIPETASATGAGTSISGEYFFAAGGLELYARVTDLSQQRLVHVAEPARGPLEESERIAGELAQDILEATVWHVQPGFRVGSSPRPPRFEAYREYRAALDFLFETSMDAQKHLERACELDPEFFEARMLLLDVYFCFGVDQGDRPTIASMGKLLDRMEGQRDRLSQLGRILLRWNRTRYHGHNSEALMILHDAADLEPADPLIDTWLAAQARHDNRPAEAVEILARIDGEDLHESTPGKFRLKTLMDSLHVLGDHDTELEVADHGLQHFPGDGFMRRRQAAALAALGRVEDVRSAVDECLATENIFNAIDLLWVTGLELRAHGQREASIELAQRWLDWSRDLSTEWPPQSRAGRIYLARALELAERWEEAYPLRRELASELQTDASDLERILALGSGRMLAPEGILAARLGERARALAISETLRTGAANPGYGVATMARAQIAALLGERDEAVELIRRALAEGYYDVEWIHLIPAFENLRDMPAYRELLRPRG